MNKNEIDVIGELLTSKPFRDQMCNTYIKENQMISNDIITYLNLERINHKYILKDRLYDENSYSKSRIRYEETVFILTCTVFEPFVHNIEKQLLIHDNFKFNPKYETLKVDKVIYNTLSLHNQQFSKFDNILNSIISKSEIYRIDILENLLKTKKIREQIITNYYNNDPAFISYLLDQYQLNWIIDKYITKSNMHTDSYYARNKLACEETFFIKKVILYSMWSTYQQEVQSIYDYVELKLNDLHIETKYLNDLYNIISAKYFKMYASHTLPMNQINPNSIKID
ncbi:hypothetical protein R2F61_00330 [Mollicutes bacterium LVI A0078]|nr:hypothetical protein RZE84_00335 [Mollicutes bacterium LVI A0075]WOO91026.1 hypothetical protein R2F61_00330 [Mollicutes bacterium LVI A0078]